jgi:hypothetical protein
MQSCGMLRRVDHVRTDVSEESITCIIRTIRTGELVATLALRSNRCTLRKDTFYRNVISYQSYTA